MTDITQTSYRDEIRSIADNMVAEQMGYCDNDRDAAEDAINDHVLHETIDGHQWVIYYAYNDDVLRYSDNDSYYEDNFGADDIAATLKERGLDGLKTVMAYFAMYADVQEELSDAFDRYEEENAPEETESS